MYTLLQAPTLSVAAILDKNAEGSKLIAEAIGGGEVLCCAGRNALL